MISRHPRLRGRATLLCLVALLAVLLALAHITPLRDLFGLSRSTLQLLSLPFVAAALASVSTFSAVVPRLLLALGVGAAALMSLGTQLTQQKGSGWIAVAALNGDERGGATRSLAVEVSRSAKRLFPDALLKIAQIGNHSAAGLEVIRLRSGPAKLDEALSYFNDNPRLTLLIWGSPRWLNVTFNPGAALLTNEGAFNSWVEGLNFEFIHSVPVIGFSFNPLSETANFLSALAVAFGKQGRAAAPEKIDILRFAAQHEALWSSYAHRAFAWWLLGNLEVQSAAESKFLEPGELLCAIESYTRARAMLRYGDNPELLAAVLNNRAFAKAMLAQVRPEAVQIKSIRQDLQLANKTNGQPNLFNVQYRAALVAKRNKKNLKLLKKPALKSKGKRTSMSGAKRKRRGR